MSFSDALSRMRGAKASVGVGQSGVPGKVGFTIEIQGGEKVNVALSRFGEDVEDWTAFWQERFGPQFSADVQANFDGEGKFVGGWMPLSPGYAAWKAKKFPGKKMLERTGRLRNSLRFANGEMGSEGLFDPQPKSLTVGTLVPYAGDHQFGKDRLPQRRFMWLAKSEVYGKLIHRWLVDRAKGAELPLSGSETGGKA